MGGGTMTPRVCIRVDNYRLAKAVFDNEAFG